jgi:hypothetical protein
MQRRSGAHAWREKTMEIAAVMMFVTVIVGIVMQFDQPGW